MIQNQQSFSDLTNAFTMCNQKDNLTRQQGETQLKAMAQNQQYPLLLFQYIQSQQNNPEFILRASIEFKLWCEKYKKIEDYNHQFLQETICQIKSSIINLYVQSNNQISNQLEVAILHIAHRDFFKNYPTLLQDLFSQIRDPNFTSLISIQTTYKVLKILQGMIEKYEYSMRSDPLYEEIIYVCDNSHNLILAITSNIISSISELDNIVEKLKVLKVLMRIFYYLNFQDLHPNFEDNLNNWMNLMQNVLKMQINSSVLGGNDFILFKCKGECLKCILLYVTKYREEFQYLIQNFSQDIWAMCNITNSDPKFDKIVLNALKYFKTLCFYQEMRSSIQGNIPTLMTSLLIPNLGISNGDITMFNQEPETYIQTFFDSYDSNSRKGVTVDLLKCLAKNYTDNLIQFIQSVIPQYKLLLDNGQQDQAQEIVLINLVIDSSTAGFRPVDGVSDLNLSPDLITYFYNNIIKVNLAKLYQSMVNNTTSLVEDSLQPVLVSFYLRFFFYFRNHIPRIEILQLAAICSYLCRTKKPALKQIVCHTVQCLLSLKENVKDLYNTNYVFNKGNIEPQIQQILQNLYNLAKENDLDVFIIKCINQIIFLMKENTSMYLVAFGDLFKDQLSKLGRGYDFTKAFLIFEGIGMLVQYNGDAKQLQELEITLSNEMNFFISKNMSDLISYVIQIYAIFIRTTGSLLYQKEIYMNLFQSMLIATNWSENNNTLFPSYIVFMDSYLQKQPQLIISTQPQLQTIIQKLFSLQQDKLIFQFIEIVIKNVNIQQLRTTGILQFILSNSVQYYQQQQTVQTNNKKVEFNKQFVLFVCKLIIKHNGIEIFKDFNDLNQGILQDILLKEIALIKTISSRLERKTLFTAMTDILLKCVSFFNMDQWGNLLNALLENSTNKLKIFSLSSYTENIGGTINQGDSGFQRLTILNEEKNYLDDIQNEDKYFGLKFNEFYSNPQIKNSLDFTAILSEANQKTLTKLITEVK